MAYGLLLGERCTTERAVGHFKGFHEKQVYQQTFDCHNEYIARIFLFVSSLPDWGTLA
jgi:hypothetical protein